MPRPNLLDMRSLVRISRTITALLVPVDGSEIKSYIIDLVAIRDEVGTRCIFPDGRHLWGPECMRRAFSTVFDLDLGASSGEYRVFSTDVLAQLALNKHLMHRYPGIYGTALILKFSNQEFVNVPQELLRPEVLKEALVQIVAGPEVVREVSVQIVAE